MKDLIIFVATGFEDTELIAAIDVLSRHDISYDLVSVENKSEVKGKVEALVKTKTLNEVSPYTYKAVFLPGGPGHKILLESWIVNEVVKDYAINKIVSAICAAPEVLLRAGVLAGKTFTSHPGFALDKNNTGSAVEVDDNIITGRDFEATIEFAKVLARAIKEKN